LEAIPSAKEKDSTIFISDFKNRKKMRIASINFWGLPWPLSVQKGSRLGKLVAFILKNKLDIVCLQEIWRTADLKILKTRLKGYYFFDSSKRKANPSGLVIISRYPIIEGAYVPFWNVNYEFVFKKGMLVVTIQKNGERLKVINTHLYTTVRPLRSKIWLRQLSELYSAIGNDKTLIFGDFNYNYKDFPLPDLYLISEGRIATRNTRNPFSKRSFNRFSKINMVCDLILSNFPVKTKSKRLIKSPIITDHYPLISEISLLQ